METNIDQIKSLFMQNNKTVEDETPFTFEGPCDDEMTLLFDDGQKLFVSRNFLCLASPVFLKMFTSDFKEKKSGIVELKDKSYENVLEFLLVLHPFEDKYITDKNIYNIVDLAEEYQVKKLIQKCRKKFRKMTSVESNTIFSTGWGHSECRRIDAVASCFKILSTAALYGYGYLEEQLISILAHVGPNVYYRYFKEMRLCKSALTEEEEDNGSHCFSFFSSNSWKGSLKEQTEKHEKCMEAFDALSDQNKLQLTLRRITKNDDNKLLDYE